MIQKDISLPSLHGMMLESLASGLDQISLRSGDADRVERLCLVDSIYVEIPRMLLRASMQVDGYHLYADLIGTVKAIYPRLLDIWKQNPMFFLRYTEDLEAHKSTNAVLKRMSILMTTARKLLNAHGWRYDSTLSSWISPAQFGGDFLLSEEEMSAEFSAFAEHALTLSLAVSKK